MKNLQQKQKKELQERITLLDKKVEKMKAELSKVLRDAGYANAAEFFTELFAVREEKRKYEVEVQSWKEQYLQAKQHEQVYENQEKKVFSTNRSNVGIGRSR